ncbi:MAG: flagellin, partial [Candidatus Marinimicrobia bacterium]|nr:flagellin [Candidatus Neomarinimicrobiota bacterium]
MSELMRIYSNVAAMQNMNSLAAISDKMGVHQMRLATGKKINSAADDPAGY